MLQDINPALAELQKASREADKIDKERRDAFMSMMKTPGWQLYMELLAARLQSLGDEVLLPAGGLDGAIASEFKKGAVFGLVLARDLPSVIVDAMKPTAATEFDEDA